MWTCYLSDAKVEVIYLTKNWGKYVNIYLSKFKILTINTQYVAISGKNAKFEMYSISDKPDKFAIYKYTFNTSKPSFMHIIHVDCNGSIPRVNINSKSTRLFLWPNTSLKTGSRVFM